MKKSIQQKAHSLQNNSYKWILPPTESYLSSVAPSTSVRKISSVIWG